MVFRPSDTEKNWASQQKNRVLREVDRMDFAGLFPDRSFVQSRDGRIHGFGAVIEPEGQKRLPCCP
jgi:hypothetical protein